MNVVTFTIFAGYGNQDGETAPSIVSYNRSILHDLVDYYLGEHGATVIDGCGFFGGNPEPGATVMVITPADTRDKVAKAVYATARAYRDQAEQLEVWVTTREEKLDII